MKGIAMPIKPTIYIVDDNEGVRGALSLLLRTAGYATKSFAGAQQFLAEFDPSAPGCLLLDVRMPGMSGLELQQWLSSRDIHIPVIIMTGHGDIAMAVQAMKDGASDFIEKPFLNQRVLDAVHKGVKDLLNRLQQAEQCQQIQQRFAQLTPREHQVMTLLLDGKLNKQVADNLNISVRTVERHRLNFMEKLQARSLMEVAKLKLAGAIDG